MGWGLFNQNFTESFNEGLVNSVFSPNGKTMNDVCILTFQIEQKMTLLKLLHVLLDESDFVVAHNGKRFDMKKIRAREWIARGLNHIHLFVLLIR